MNNREVLLSNMNKVHTTEMGIDRIKRNLGLEAEDIICWCQKLIQKEKSIIIRKGKNWCVEIDGVMITINAYSYTIITAHKMKR
jgi:hypothetical protein